MIYPENTLLLALITKEIKEAWANDPTKENRISVIERISPFLDGGLGIVNRMDVIGLYDRYIITKPEYRGDHEIAEIRPKVLDGVSRLNAWLNQNEAQRLRPAEFDNNLASFFSCAHSINDEIIVLPRYQPEELVSCILFGTKPESIRSTDMTTLFSDKLFFTTGINKYDIDKFKTTMSQNTDLGDEYNVIKINGKSIKFIYRRGLDKIYGDWVWNVENTLWEQTLYAIAGYINYNLKEDKDRATFMANNWSGRIGNLSDIATYNTCYLTYLLKALGKIE